MPSVQWINLDGITVRQKGDNGNVIDFIKTTRYSSSIAQSERESERK